MVASHLDPHFALVVNDPAMFAKDGRLPGRAVAGSPAEICRCELIILAVPVSELANAIKCLRPHLRPGCIAVDVGSVKVKPARVMLEELPPFVDIVATHPLFGPQSGRNGIKGRKIAVCPVQGSAVARRFAAFLRHALGLKVFVTSPEEHDWEASRCRPGCYPCDCKGHGANGAAADTSHDSDLRSPHATNGDGQVRRSQRLRGY
jgi:prephenate dehydrogenase